MLIRQTDRICLTAPIWAAILLTPLPLRADEVEVVPNGTSATLSNVVVVNASDTQVTLRTREGAVNTQPRPTTGKLFLDDEPAWNAAEDAAATSQWDPATDGYLKTLRTTVKPWLKTRAALRILETAPKARRYDAVVTAYVSLVHTDPATAASHRPALPETDSTYIDSALAATDKALAEPNLTADQKQSLLSLQLDLYRIRKNDAKADEVLRELNQLATTSTGPDAARRFADLKLTTARVALDRNDPTAAIAALTAARPALTDPAQQEDALYLLAQATEAQAAADNAPATLKDAGLAYMRVVAHFQDSPANRHVADSLARTASILEKLHETKIAADLYEQAAIQYDTRPEAQTARANARRLLSSDRLNK